MFTRLSSGRLVVLLLAFILMLPAPAAYAEVEAQEDSEFYFEGDDGNVVLSNVTVGYVDAGYGNHIAVLTITPTQDEIDTLLLNEWSHVDFEFHFRGLEPSVGQNGFAPSVSDYARQVGARVDHDSGYPVYHAMGLNIDDRWVADVPLVVLAPIFGYEPSGEGRPTVSVEMASSKWWFSDGGCEIVYERTTNQITLQYCTVQDLESHATLYDEYGDTQFRSQ